MKDKKIALSLRDKTNKTFEFESFKALKHFINDEYEVWAEIHSGLSNSKGNIAHFANAAVYLNQIKKNLQNFENNFDTWDESTLQAHINQHITNNPANLTQHWIWSGHPFCKEWLNIYEKYGFQVAHTFIEAFIGNHQLSGLNNVSLANLKGAVLAYEFELQDESTLTKRRKSEKASISQVRNSMIDAKNQLFNDVHEFQDEYESWKVVTQRDASRLYTISKNLGERLSRQQRNRHDSQMREWQENIEHLENTYQEKLRLEKPAEYWNKKACSYFKQGVAWSILLGVFLLSGLAGFGYFLFSWLEGLQLKVQLDSLQGAALFITILSIYAFSIKALSRMVFSSFHLQRDAEEREQLTHVYLALTHEKDELDVEARNIILQSLFSRADTGLLSGDSGPTMPGLHEIVKATSTK